MKKILLVAIGIMFISGLFLVAVQAEEATLDKKSVIEAADQTAEEVKAEAAEEIKEEAAEELKEATDEAAESAGELKDITEEAEKAQEEAGSK